MCPVCMCRTPSVLVRLTWYGNHKPIVPSSIRSPNGIMIHPQLVVLLSSRFPKNHILQISRNFPKSSAAHPSQHSTSHPLLPATPVLDITLKTYCPWILCTSFARNCPRSGSMVGKSDPLLSHFHVYANSVAINAIKHYGTSDG